MSKNLKTFLDSAPLDDYCMLFFRACCFCSSGFGYWVGKESTCVLVYLFIPSLSSSFLRSLFEFGTKRREAVQESNLPSAAWWKLRVRGDGFIIRAGKRREAAARRTRKRISEEPRCPIFYSRRSLGQRGVFFGQSEWIMKMSAASVALILTYFMITKSDQRKIMMKRKSCLTLLVRQCWGGIAPRWRGS